MKTTTRGIIGSSVAALLALVFIPTAVNAQQQQQEQQTEKCQVTVQSEAGQQSPMAQQQKQDQEQRQEQARTQHQQETPTVKPGQQAVALQVQLSGNLRQITDFSADENSGLELASEDDLGRADMAARTEEEGQQQKQPISMERGSQTATVWINTEDAEQGTYQVSFRGNNSKCDTQIRVSENGSGR